MKTLTLISRILLGLIFLTFGLNGFLQFLPQPPLAGHAGEFFAVVVATRYIALPMLIQVVVGIMLLTNLYRPLALTLIAPVIVNILLFHITMNPAGIAPGLVATVLWCVLFYSVRSAFAGLFLPTPVAERTM